MQNLTRASEELFRRGPDECFATFDALWQHCQETKARSVERWPPCPRRSAGMKPAEGIVPRPSRPPLSGRRKKREARDDPRVPRRSTPLHPRLRSYAPAGLGELGRVIPPGLAPRSYSQSPCGLWRCTAEVGRAFARRRRGKVFDVGRREKSGYRHRGRTFRANQTSAARSQSPFFLAAAGRRGATLHRPASRRPLRPTRGSAATRPPAHRRCYGTPNTPGTEPRRYGIGRR